MAYLFTVRFFQSVYICKKTFIIAVYTYHCTVLWPPESYTLCAIPQFSATLIRESDYSTGDQLPAGHTGWDGVTEYFSPVNLSVIICCEL